MPEALLSDVPRETLLQLKRFEYLVKEWTPKINLIASTTLPDLRQRHTLDCIQLNSLLPSNGRLIDLGSGAGFPGVVLAIMGTMEIHLIESDKRKAAFLREVAVQLGIDVTIHNARIEKVRDIAATVVTARACATLIRLCGWAFPFLEKGSFCLFPKGRNYIMELEQAATRWRFTHDVIPSRIDPEGVILKIGSLSPL